MFCLCPFCQSTSNLREGPVLKVQWLQSKYDRGRQLLVWMHDWVSYAAKKMRVSLPPYHCHEAANRSRYVDIATCKDRQWHHRMVGILNVIFPFWFTKRWRVTSLPLPPPTGRRRLRLSSVDTCEVPQTRTSLGDRSFTVAELRLWNSLPLPIRDSALNRRGDSTVDAPVCWGLRRLVTVRLLERLTHLLTYLFTCWKQDADIAAAVLPLPRS